MSHPGPTDDERAAITYLRSPLAVRARCENVLARGLDGGLTHFAVDLDQIAAAAAEVAAVTRERYPTLQVPGHGRMNQLGAGDVDRVADLAAQMAGLPRGPITNPGRASIEAVLNPAETDALFMVADGTGGHEFNATLEGHNAAVERWFALRRQRGEM